MINPATSSASGAADAAPVVKSKTDGSGEAKGKGGFSETLSGMNRQGHGPVKDESALQPAAGDAAAPGMLSEGLTDGELSGLAGRIPGREINAGDFGNTALSEALLNGSEDQQSGLKALFNALTGDAGLPKNTHTQRTLPAEITQQDVSLQLKDVLSLLTGASGATQTDESTDNTAKARKSGNDDETQFLTDSRIEALATDSGLKVPHADTGQGQNEAEAEGGARRFRFANASGKGQSMVMTIGDRARDDMDMGTEKRLDTVTVLDSRRFIGLAPTSNAAAITSALSGDSEWVSAARGSAALTDTTAHGNTGKVVHTLKLHMTPIDLGSVTATLRLTGEELSVHLTAQTSAAYRQLKDDASGMLETLRAQGFNVEHVTVSIAPADKSDSSSSQPNAQQQPGFSANRDGSAEPGRQQFDGQGSGEGQKGTHDTVSETGSAAASGTGTHRGNLYL